MFSFKSQEQIWEGSKKFLGGSLLEAMLGLWKMVRLCDQYPRLLHGLWGADGLDTISEMHLWPGFPEFLNPCDTNLVAG